MRWQKWARLIVGIGGIALAVVLVMMTRGRHTAAVKPVAPVTDPKVDYVSQNTSQVRTKDNKEASIIESAKASHFPDGRTVFEHPSMKFNRGDRQFTIDADRGESKAPPGSPETEVPNETTFSGHVHLSTSDGFDLTCGKATYAVDSGIVTIPGPTTFSRKRMTGHGLGATYDRNADTLVLLDRAQVDVRPDPQGQSELHAKAKTLTMTRPAHLLQLDEDASIQRNGLVMRGKSGTVMMTDDDERVKRVELRAASSVVQAATATASATTMVAQDIDLDFVPEENRLQATDLRVGASITQPVTAKSKPPQMKADTIHVEFQPDGRAVKHAVMTDRADLAMKGDDNGDQRVRASTITIGLSPDGQRATGLEANGTVIIDLSETATSPRRQIRAEKFSAGGSDDKGLTGASFEADPKVGLVSMNEVQKADPKTSKKGTTRALTSTTMGLVLGGDMGSIEKATFEGEFTFKDTEQGKNDPSTIAHAGSARYREDNGALAIAPSLKTPVTDVTTDRLWVTAKDRIEMFTKNSNLTATGGVQSQLKPDPAQSKAAVGLFDASVKVYATADSLTYADATSQAKYSGSVHVWQGQTFDIQAGSVTLSSNSGSVSADGGVQSMFVLDKAPVSGSPPASSSAKSACPVPNASCVNAQSMNYDDAQRKATYTTGATFVGSGDVSMAGDAITLLLAAEGRTLETARAEGTMVANLGDRQVQGSRLTYTVSRSVYVVTGEPLTSVQRSVDAGKESCRVQVGREIQYRLADEALKQSEEFRLTDANGRLVSETHSATCAAVLKVIK